MNDLKPLLDALGKLSPKIPVEVDLWSVREIAALLKRSEAVVRERIVTLPGFPKAIRLPAASAGATRGAPQSPVRRGRPSVSRAGLGQPLWKAREVISWIESHQERQHTA